MLTRRAALLFPLVLTACASPYDLLRKYEGPDSAVVYASVGMTPSNKENYAIIEFKKIGTDSIGRLEFSPKAMAAFGGTSVDFEDSRGRSSLIQKRLPPGDYEIVNYFSGTNAGTWVREVRGVEMLGSKFTVKAGESVYLGEFLLDLRVIDRRPVASVLLHSDQMQRDLQKAGVAPTATRSAVREVSPSR